MGAMSVRPREVGEEKAMEAADPAPDHEAVVRQQGGGGGGHPFVLLPDCNT
jgi:hypothetical protein